MLNSAGENVGLSIINQAINEASKSKKKNSHLAGPASRRQINIGLIQNRVAIVRDMYDMACLSRRIVYGGMPNAEHWYAIRRHRR
jgi:hypothetical protein